MANKQVDELQSLATPNVDDLVPVYNSDSTSSEKLQKVTVSNVLTPDWKPYTGDGASPGLNVVNGIATMMVNIGAPESAPYATVSAADFIISVIENGDPPYFFGINKVGDMPSVIYPDPRDAVLILDCTDQSASPILVEVWVSDNTGNQTWVESYVLLDDPNGLCAGP